MIPEELRRLPQWVVAGPNKEPINPRTGALASVNDPSTWGTYDEAVATGLHVGFVLTPSDPYTIIDLDNKPDDPATPEELERHRRIYEAFDTYAELSLSGRGVHIICKGAVPQGRKRDKVEIYSAQRYMVCTGRALRNVDIRSCQEMLDILYQEISQNGAYYDLPDLIEHDANLDDSDIIEMAANAKNGDKFNKLCAGDWRDDYPSQSEADFALLSYLAFYTRSNSQVKRLFRMSALGKREKAQREDYLDMCLQKIRAEEPPVLNFDQLISSLDPIENGGTHTPPVTTAPGGETASKPVMARAEIGPIAPIAFPPGFVGEIARYIYESSPRPVPEIGIAAALGLAAGVCGRQYNISGTGLNLYIILLAKTGVGKEGGSLGIERMVASIRNVVPLVDSYIGPGVFASGAGLIRHLDEHPCFVSVLGEFGLTLQNLSEATGGLDANARRLRKDLLELYGKSGQGGVVRPTAYSEKEKNTKTLYSPSLTIFGESTPETFYAGLSLQHISDGLIPRFLRIEYAGDRPKRNRKANYPPPPGIADRFADVVSTCLTMAHNQSWAMVTMDQPASEILDAFDEEVDYYINHGSNNEAIRELWNRSHLNALRLAAILTVFDRPHNPVVTSEEARWAVEVVRNDAKNMSARFETGDVGEGESKQGADLERILHDYVSREYEELKKYGVMENMWQKRIVPHVYLQRRTVALAAFRKHRLGARKALSESIGDLVSAGRLIEVPKEQMSKQFGTSQTAFFFRG